MQVIDQKRITLLSLMGMAVGETLEEKYDQASPMVDRLVDDGWFGGSGNSIGRKPSSQKQGSPSPSKNDGKPATARDVQRVLDLDDSYDTDKLEAMTRGEIRDLIAQLS